MIWKQAWLSTADIGIESHWGLDWQNFINTLQHAHIHLTDDMDELAWSYAHVGGLYTPKMVYLSLINLDTCASL